VKTTLAVSIFIAFSAGCPMEPRLNAVVADKKPMAISSAALKYSSANPGENLLESSASDFLQRDFVGARRRAEEFLSSATQAGDLSGQASSHALLGFVEYTAGDRTKAASHLAQARDLYSQGGDSLGAWISLKMLAQVERRGEELVAARHHLEDGLAILDASRVLPTSLKLDAFLILGRVIGVPVESLRVFLSNPKLLDMVKPLILKSLEVLTRVDLAEVLTESGQLDEADRELDRASSADPLALLSGTVAAARGTIRFRQWRLEEARRAFESALASLDQMESIAGNQAPPVLRLQYLDQIQQIELLHGGCEDARHWNDQARQVTLKGRDRLLEIRVLRDRISLETACHNIDQARKALDEADKVGSELRKPEILAELESSRSFLLFLSGRYEEAAVHLVEAIRTWKRLGMTAEEAGDQLFLAEVYMVNGDVNAARVALDRSRFLAREGKLVDLGQLVEFVASALPKGDVSDETFVHLKEVLRPLEQGGVGAVLGPPDLFVLLFGAPARVGRGEVSPEFEMQIETSIEVAKGRGLWLAQVGGWTALTMIHLRRGETEKAREAMSEVQAIWRQIGEEDLSAMARTVFAAILWKERRFGEALQELGGGLGDLDRLAQDIRSEQWLTSFLGGDRSLLFNLLVDLQDKAGNPRKAFDAGERARARATLGLLENPRKASIRSPELSQVDELRGQIVRLERTAMEIPAEGRERLGRDLEERRQRLEELVQRYRMLDPRSAELGGTNPSRLEEIQSDLEPGTTVVSYFIVAQRLLIWVLDYDHFATATVAWGKTEDREVACLLEQLGPTGRARAMVPKGLGSEDLDDCAPWSALSEDLWEKLIGPVISHLGNDRLIVVPHSILHSVPFAALRNPQTDHYMVEDYTISYAPSASAIRFLHGRSVDRVSAALVIGDPRSAEPNLTPLKAAQAEAREIAARLGTRALIGTEATESAFRARATEAEIIHLAVHGVYLPANPAFSYLALSPEKPSHKKAVDGRADDRKGDGRLEMDEVFSDLNLRRAGMVVLSACETSRGGRTGGDEIVGLVRAFLFVGSGSVLSTLWRIDDKKTGHLMTTFYDLVLKGVPASRALRQAQIGLLRRPETAHPTFWAAFGLTGEFSVVAGSARPR
jgi:tetratricopeptide (TPR) repeat protein